MNPLSTIEGIRAAIKQDPNLRFNPNLVKTYQSLGGTLSNYGIPLEPTDLTAPPVQQSTTAMRMTATQNSAKLDQKVSQISSSNANAAATTEAKPSSVSVVRDLDNGDGTRTVTYSDGKTARVQATKNEDGTETYKELSPTDEINYDKNYQINSAKQRAQSEKDYANTTLDSISAKSTAATQALIQSIKTTYEARIRLMENTNRALEGGITQSGIRSGRSRYTSEIQRGILSDAEQKGIDRVSKLEGDMLSLIAQAETARTDKDLEIFNDRMDALDKIDKNLQTEVQNLQKEAYNKLKEMRDSEKAAYEAEQANVDLQTSKSDAAAPALLNTMNDLADEAARVDFLQKYSEKTGVPIEYLLSSIEKYATDQQKEQLNIANIQNQIKNRDKTTAISGARLKLDQDKQNFNPTSDERAKVGKYLAKYGSDEDTKQADKDKDFFYYILGLAEQEDL